MNTCDGESVSISPAFLFLVEIKCEKLVSKTDGFDYLYSRGADCGVETDKTKAPAVMPKKRYKFGYILVKRGDYGDCSFS